MGMPGMLHYAPHSLVRLGERLTGAVLCACAGMPLGLLLYGWAAQYRAHLGLVSVPTAPVPV